MRQFTHTFELPTDPATALPLFTPRGEEAWVPGWKPDYLHPKSGETGRGMVFTTKDKSGKTIVWTCLDYLPAIGIARYFRAVSDHQASLVEVTCTSLHEGTTTVRVSYRHLPLSPEGAADIEALREDDFRRDVDGWRDLVMPHLSAA